jgi:hypothetical protein
MGSSAAQMGCTGGYYGAEVVPSSSTNRALFETCKRSGMRAIQLVSLAGCLAVWLEEM